MSYILEHFTLPVHTSDFDFFFLGKKHEHIQGIN